MTQKHLSIVGFSKDRDDKDFYPTPPETTMALLKREKFGGTIWECASGNGAMAKVIESVGYKVISSDIRKDDDVYGIKGWDFLNKGIPIEGSIDNIISNSPYRHAKEFVEKSLKIANKKVAMLLKLVFLEGSGRYEFFKNSPLKTVYVFCRRQKIYKRGEVGKNSGLIAYAWFVFDKEYKGEPTIRWIP